AAPPHPVPVLRECGAVPAPTRRHGQGLQIAPAEWPPSAPPRERPIRDCRPRDAASRTSPPPTPPPPWPVIRSEPRPTAHVLPRRPAGAIACPPRIPRPPACGCP